MPTKTKSAEIQLVRILDAPIQAVWDAWTDLDQVSKWWGPRGFTITTHSKDLRVGGSWRYTMHGPEGVEFINISKYLEVEEKRKLVYDHGGNDEANPLFRSTVLFEALGEKTRMDMTMTFPSAEAAEQTAKHIKKANGDSTWDRLAEYLAKKRFGKEVFVINRSFAVPRAVMYQMWTDPEHYSKWPPAPGFEMKFIRADIRSGGNSFSCMSNDEGMKIHALAEYLEVQSPDRLVYKQQFGDENGKVVRHPMSATFPETLLVTVDLNEEGPGQTRITINWEPYGDCPAEDVETFASARAGMTHGWTSMFERLDAHLAQL